MEAYIQVCGFYIYNLNLFNDKNYMYVGVYGHLKSFQGVKKLVSFSVRHVHYTNFVLYCINCAIHLLILVY